MTTKQAKGPSWRRWTAQYPFGVGKGVMVCEGVELVVDGRPAGVAVQRFYTVVDAARAFDADYLDVSYGRRGGKHRAGHRRLVHIPTGFTLTREEYRTEGAAKEMGVKLAGVGVDWTRVDGKDKKTLRAAYDAICAAGLR